MDSPGAIIFVLANLGIFFGYVFLAAFVVPKVTVSLIRTRIGGVVFFLTCGLTHLELVYHVLFVPDLPVRQVLLSPHMIVLHGVQVIAVWAFVTGLYIEFVRWGPWAPLENPARKRRTTDV